MDTGEYHESVARVPAGHECNGRVIPPVNPLNNAFITWLPALRNGALIGRLENSSRAQLQL